MSFKNSRYWFSSSHRTYPLDLLVSLVPKIETRARARRRRIIIVLFTKLTSSSSSPAIYSCTAAAAGFFEASRVSLDDPQRNLRNSPNIAHFAYFEVLSPTCKYNLPHKRFFLPVGEAPGLYGTGSRMEDRVVH